ncbi:hypothetical protein QYE76_026099 [Lolium multiflorum]|uniref:DUF4220 domain-containing protein n=1 Tax=Lolium multiflorum TaxID=4521 RepID=A0AAD8VUU0_LOLMU|nr:hypothetical protein QYE76_026099 [Lolium multiflorum]
MGDLSGAVQWWDEWKLHVLVFASLGIQYFLTIFACGRKFSIPSWFRFVIWLSYLGGDAIAIYALATLFNRQKKSSSNGSRDLEVLWAPFLLMHLGGQVTVALYVFCQSWSSSADSKLLATAILIFIPGIFKCFAKPWGLKYASFHSLAESLDLAQRTTASNREEELQKYVQDARTCVLANNNESSGSEKLYVPGMLFADFGYTYSRRLTNLKSFWELDDSKTYSSLRNGLSGMFDLLYTRKNMFDFERTEVSGRDCVGTTTWWLSFFLPIVAIVLFHISHKKEFRSDDVAVTFVLLYSTFVLEFLSLSILRTCVTEWPENVAQRSILGQFANSKRHVKLVRLATFLGCKDLVNQYWSKEKIEFTGHFTGLVRDHVRDGWKEYITDADSYREFSDIRGQWTLERQGCHGRLDWSLEKPFDESILLWHIATELCFYQMGPSCDWHDAEISNYMMHLLVANPEMLMPGSRRSLFAIAYNELEAILKECEDDTLMEEGKIAKQVIHKVKSAHDTRTKKSFIYDACVLAEGLMHLGHAKMWDVIHGVWLEMLCFSAGRCRGFLHAKALGSGGEFLSYAWLLLAQYGMETFPERLQRTQKLHLSVETRKRLQTRGKDVPGPSACQGTEDEITAGPPTSQGDCAMEIVVSP